MHVADWPARNFLNKRLERVFMGNQSNKDAAPAEDGHRTGLPCAISVLSASVHEHFLEGGYLRTSKASRDYPKKKDYGPPPGPPEIMHATRAQQRLAREVKGEQELRLTA